MPDPIHDGHKQRPTDHTDYNSVSRVSVMVVIILPDKLSFLMESAMETATRTSNADVNIALSVEHQGQPCSRHLLITHTYIYVYTVYIFNQVYHNIG